MMIQRLKGAGLPNVYLDGGTTIRDSGEGQTTAYADLDGLYKVIARAIAMRASTLNFNELKFLRKRLGMSQADVAALGGKDVQVAAKWEKGTLPVPKAEANLLRITALTKFGSSKDISKVAHQLTDEASTVDLPYVFTFDGAKWVCNDVLAAEFASEQAGQVAMDAVISAKNSSQYEVRYTSDSQPAEKAVKTLHGTTSANYKQQTAWMK